MTTVFENRERSTVPQVVIVGGGFGGLQAALALRHAPVRVILIDRNNHHVFQPLLYQVATAGLSPANITAPIRSILRRQRNTDVLMAEVTGVDTEQQAVLLADRKIPYDYLILATGARHGYFGHEEWEEDAPGLKTIPDATAIRRRILLAFEKAEMEPDEVKRRALLTFVLVGAGPTGVEMAGAISELAHRALTRDFRHIDPKEARILLVEGGKRILNAFPEDLAHSAQKALEEMGVEVRAGQTVNEVDEEGVFVGSERIATHTVIWAAGVVASPAGRWLGAETDRAGRVKVEPDLSVPHLANVFVVGDAMTLTQEGKPLPGVAPVAMQQGRYVARLIESRLRNRTVPPFHYHDKGNLATVGRKFAIVQIGKFKLSGFLAWIFWLALHIVYLIGFRNRLQVLLEWMWAYVTFDRGARLIVQEDANHPAAKPTVIAK